MPYVCALIGLFIFVSRVGTQREQEAAIERRKRRGGKERDRERQGDS